MVGYDNTTIDPKTLNIVEGQNEYSLTISATGTLTLHVTEDGTENGTPIVGAVFKRTDVSGIEYGNEITTDSSGNAVFNNVPFDATNAPNIYFKQTSSDKTHEFDKEIQTTTLNTDTRTLEITNTPAVVRVLKLTDENYENLPIENAEININESI